MKFTIDINCDMGEGMENDALLMPYINSANIACGYHAGSAALMQQTVELALNYRVNIGAHPGFADKENFGRKEMHLSETALTDLIQEQVYQLKKIATSLGAGIKHVKPHGALYNMSAKNSELAKTIASAVFALDPHLVLYGLSGSHSIVEAAKMGLQTASEVFADRTYQDDGSLTPRTEPGAMIISAEQSMQQVLQMVHQQQVTSVKGHAVNIKAETLCLHGDGAHAVSFAKNINAALKKSANDAS